jgi:uncharacterized membrane protein
MSGDSGDPYGGRLTRRREPTELHASGSGYWPVTGPVVIAFLLLVALLGAAVLTNVVSYSFIRLGLDRHWAIALLLASVLGSRLNIPVARLPGPVVLEPMLVRVYGMWQVVPLPARVGTKIVAVNVGGAVVPVCLATYLVVRDGLGAGALLATMLVIVPVHLTARVVPGVGVVVPALLPPLAAAFAAWSVGPAAIAATAYVAGTVGTLVGADLTNLHRVRDLSAPVVSIGGAGTFDGIFMTGVLATLLTTM